MYYEYNYILFLYNVYDMSIRDCEHKYIHIYVYMCVTIFIITK